MVGPQSAGSLGIKFHIRTSLGATFEQPARPPPQEALQPWGVSWCLPPPRPALLDCCRADQVGKGLPPQPGRGGSSCWRRTAESPFGAEGFLLSALPTSFHEKRAEGLVHLCNLEGDPTGMAEGIRPPDPAEGSPSLLDAQRIPLALGDQTELRFPPPSGEGRRLQPMPALPAKLACWTVEGTLAPGRRGSCCSSCPEGGPASPLPLLNKDTGGGRCSYLSWRELWESEGGGCALSLPRGSWPFLPENHCLPSHGGIDPFLCGARALPVQAVILQGCLGRNLPE